MREYLVTLLAVGLFGSSIIHAATFTGKVTKSDGVTPLKDIRVTLFKHAPDSYPPYPIYRSAYTDASGRYSISADLVGVYLVHFSASSASDQFGWIYPYQPFSYYQELPVEGYQWETYNDVTAQTPNKPPVQFVVSDLKKDYPLALVKLNTLPRQPDCLATGPITINGTPYSSFFSYSGGPSLPVAGGTLNITFKVVNTTDAAISTNLQAVAFLERDDTSYADQDKSLVQFPRKAQTLPAKSTTPVNLSVKIPAALMSARPNGAYGSWAFNLGIQMATTTGVANCKEIIFPIHHGPASAKNRANTTAADGFETEMRGEVVPFGLDEKGQVIEWGPLRIKGR